MRFYVMIAVIYFMAAGASEADSADRSQSVRDVYTLGSGDRVKVTVYGEDDLSGVFEVNGTGAIAYPLIGDVEAGGKTIRELEKSVAMKLRNGYLRKPRVSIEVTNYRPFYILGEVKRPVRRAGAPKGSETEAKPDDLLYPGDVIRVPERFF